MHYCARPIFDPAGQVLLEIVTVAGEQETVIAAVRYASSLHTDPVAHIAIVAVRPVSSIHR